MVPLPISFTQEPSRSHHCPLLPCPVFGAGPSALPGFPLSPIIPGTGPSVSPTPFYQPSGHRLTCFSFLAPEPGWPELRPVRKGLGEAGGPQARPVSERSPSTGLRPGQNRINGLRRSSPVGFLEEGAFSINPDKEQEGTSVDKV